ncbi:MAG: S8 family serine peptidase, partial [Chloroflexi bacterium]|nr:S8 family serine peptidase [Chloroflexota bacterium]
MVPATMLLVQGSTANAVPSAERPQSKVEPALTRLHDLYILAGMPDDPADLNSMGPMLELSEDGFLEFAQIYDGLVLIEAAAVDAESAMQALASVGLTQGTVFDHAISGYVPILAIPDLEEIDGLTAVRLAQVDTSGGSVTSQGDAALFADVARSAHGVDGTGVTIGVISDSYNCLGGASADVSSGDLPSDVVVQQEETSCTSGTDEGRAMMQLIHDVAPGADLIFQTGFLGAANMAQGILDLATAGADVIVDDLTYLTQPFFQDGVIAQAVDTVVAGGVAYFSSAGNYANQSYESDFRPGTTYASGAFPSAGGAPTFFGGVAHDFDPSGGVTEFQRVTFPPGVTRITFQWDQPALSVSGGSGSANDVDLYVFDEAITTVLVGGAEFDFGGDPMEFISVQNNSGVPVTARLGIFYDNSLGGPTPGHIKYIHFDPLTIIDFPTDSSTIFGHHNAAGAGSVGAADFEDTPKFGTSPPVIETFSSIGGTTILFDTSGNSVSQDRQKPDFVAPDGTDTTFFGFDTADSGSFPNFFGTSAAAPHAAAAAGLLLEADGALTPAQIYSHFESTAVEMGAAGYDVATGHGLIDVSAALLAMFEDPVVNAGANQAANEGDTVNLAPATFTD